MHIKSNITAAMTSHNILKWVSLFKIRSFSICSLLPHTLCLVCYVQYYYFSWRVPWEFLFTTCRFEYMLVLIKNILLVIYLSHKHACLNFFVFGLRTLHERWHNELWYQMSMLTIHAHSLSLLANKRGLLTWTESGTNNLRNLF